MVEPSPTRGTSEEQETAAASSPPPAGAPRHLPRAGERLGPYVVERALGSGGMGAVYVARDALGREVALKVLLSLPGGEEEARFEREARAAARLRHPGVVAVHDLGRDAAGRLYLVMDLVPGESLQERLRREGPLPEMEVARLGVEVAAALAAAHAAGVLHRDLKPHNVLVTPAGRAVLTDFGLARLVDQSQALTRTGELLGTPAYMPPEQASGEPVDERADVYGLGATLYALLCGRPPFQGPPIQLLKAVLFQPPPGLRTLRPELSAGIEAICLRCLAKEPDERYATARELGEELSRLLGGRPLAAAPRPRRVRTAWVLASGSALALALVLGLAVVLRGRPTEPAPAPTTPQVPDRAPALPVTQRPGFLVEVQGLVRQGELAQALACCDRVLAEGGGAAHSAARWKAEVLRLAGRWDEALALVQGESARASAPHQEAHLLFGSGRPGEAERLLAELGPQGELDVGVHVRRAAALVLRNDPDEAIREVVAALLGAPPGHPAHREAARLLALLQETKHDQQLATWLESHGAADLGLAYRYYPLPGEGAAPSPLPASDGERDAALLYLQGHGDWLRSRVFADASPSLDLAAIRRAIEAAGPGPAEASPSAR